MISGHVPVLLDEAIKALDVDASGCYVDGTFGRGGHARAILDRLGSAGRLLALDRDPIAADVAASWPPDPRFHFCSGNFSNMAEYVERLWPGRLINGVLLDLGVSSPQIDDASRGFSFTQDGPLDMRMDTRVGQPVGDWLNSAPMEDIARVLDEFGEERFARRIARAIVERRLERPFVRTLDLATVISSAIPVWEKHKHPATRSFQALRILVNSELTDLRSCLESLPRFLATGARVVVISFHSLEDRLVKRFFKGSDAGPRLPRGLPVFQPQKISAFRLLGRPERPSPAEQERNPRARSAILRVAEFAP